MHCFISKTTFTSFITIYIIVITLIQNASSLVVVKPTNNVSPRAYGDNSRLFSDLKSWADDEDKTASTASSVLRRQTLVTVLTSTLALIPSKATASSSKSRTTDYPIQRSEREWAYLLSGAQYNILRQGGTERPYSSILEGEERPGLYVCAGCDTPLFESSVKFHSGTGWPSYASALPGVEIEDVNPVQASLGGAEIRCRSCGGHLGDVFNDGKLFLNTEAFKTGKRFCVDGAALVFKPDGGGDFVVGDTMPSKKRVGFESFLEPPKIQPRSRD